MVTAMTTTIYTDRSRVETYQLCARRRFLEYHECGVGIRPMRKPLPLVVGGSVHVGLSLLLREGQMLMECHAGEPELLWSHPHIRVLEDKAVAAALADFAQHAAALELDAGERLAMEGPAVAQPADLTQQLEASLGMPSPGRVAPLWSARTAKWMPTSRRSRPAWSRPWCAPTPDAVCVLC